MKITPSRAVSNKILRATRQLPNFVCACCALHCSPHAFLCGVACRASRCATMADGEVMQQARLILERHGANTFDPANLLGHRMLQPLLNNRVSRRSLLPYKVTFESPWKGRGWFAQRCPICQVQLPSNAPHAQTPDLFRAGHVLTRSRLSAHSCVGGLLA